MYTTELLFRSFYVFFFFLNMTHKNHWPSTRIQIPTWTVDDNIEIITYFRNTHRGLSTHRQKHTSILGKNKNNWRNNKHTYGLHIRSAKNDDRKRCTWLEFRRPNDNHQQTRIEFCFIANNQLSINICFVTIKFKLLFLDGTST